MRTLISENIDPNTNRQRVKEEVASSAGLARRAHRNADMEANDFFVRLRSWAPAVQNEAASLKKKLTNPDLKGADGRERKQPQSARPHLVTKSVLRVTLPSRAGQDPGRDAGGSTAIDAMTGRVGRVEDLLRLIEDGTAANGQSAQQLARVARLLHG